MLSNMIPLYAPSTTSKSANPAAVFDPSPGMYAGPHHSRHVSASSMSSLGSAAHFDHFASNGQIPGTGYPDAFGTLPVNTGSPFTDPTSASDPDSPEGVPGGRKRTAALAMRRARSAATPYAQRRGSLSGGEWSDTRSESADDSDLAELLASSSREGSIHSDWGAAAAGATASRGASVEPSVVAGVGGMHLDPQTGLLLHGPGGPPVGMSASFVDPYGAVAPAYHHPHMVYGSGPPATSMHSAMGMMPMSMVPPGSALPGMIMMGAPGSLGPPGPHPSAAQQMLESSETYEALAQHIRGSVTTSAADRARQAFVQAWLNSSYVAYTDGNVSRQGLYGSYLRICSQYDIKPINSASFGKAVRQCFPNIKTRRLGVRGNSKYHYCGIRPATAKEADILMNLSKNEQPESNHSASDSFDNDDAAEFSDSGSHRNVALVGVDQGTCSPPVGGVITGSGQRLSLNGHRPRTSLGAPIDSDAMQPQTPRTARPNMTQGTSSGASGSGSMMLGGDGALADAEGLKQIGSSGMSFPDVEEVLDALEGMDINQDVARRFWADYKEHSRNVFESVKALRFDQFELSLRTFWSSLDASAREVAEAEALTSIMYRSDAFIYDEILDYLHSQTLNQMPAAAFNTLRSLAPNMEQVIIVSLDGFSQQAIGPKIELAARFGHLVSRHLGICQLAQALAGVFGNQGTLKEMATAWSEIDFDAVRNQAALVTNCHHEILNAIFEEFRQLLNQPGANVEAFIAFVEKTYEACLQPSRFTGERGLSPRALLVRWTYVSAQLIRDLTLASAPCFGSFQIVNLFFEEWLGFKVLRRVALGIGSTPHGTTGSTQGMESAGLVIESDDSLTYASLSGPTLHLPSSGSTFTSHTDGDDTADEHMGFIFSPNTTQAFAAAAAQVSGPGHSSTTDSPDQFPSFADAIKTPVAAAHPIEGQESNMATSSTTAGVREHMEKGAAIVDMDSQDRLAPPLRKASCSPIMHNPSAGSSRSGSVVAKSVGGGVTNHLSGDDTTLDADVFSELMDVTAFSNGMDDTDANNTATHGLRSDETDQAQTRPSPGSTS